jgi:hypothetical protein
MRASFTPGPWKATPNGYGVWFVHSGPDLFHDPTGTEYRDLICGGNNHNTLTNANARLIAAAPELYEALHDLLCNLDAASLIHDPEGKTLRERAAVVLAKARGLPPGSIGTCAIVDGGEPPSHPYPGNSE